MVTTQPAGMLATVFSGAGPQRDEEGTRWDLRITCPNGRVLSLIAGEYLYSTPRKFMEDPSKYKAWEVGTWVDRDNGVRVEGYLAVDVIEVLVSRLLSGEDFDVVSGSLGLDWRS